MTMMDFINSVGFPAFMCVMMGVYIYKVQTPLIEALEGLKITINMLNERLDDLEEKQKQNKGETNYEH